MSPTPDRASRPRRPSSSSEVVIGSYFDDEGKRGDSPGDVLVFTLRLTDENGADVGKTTGQCTFHASRWEMCTYAWDIADRGEIVAEGTYPPYADLHTPPFDFAVTGGTGDFSNVRGAVHVEVLDAAERFTFSLIHSPLGTIAPFRLAACRG